MGLAGLLRKAGRSRVNRSLINLAGNSAGATAAEYAIILAIIGSAIALGSVFLGASIADAMNDTTSNLSQ